jgi:hypothetical protein
VDALLVILKVYHLLVEIFVARLPLNPEPLIDPAAAPVRTPLPLEI